MLNPFIIEKNIMDNLTFLETAAHRIKLALSKEALLKYGNELDKQTKNDMEKCMLVLNVPTKKYSCSYCNKEFNDGRKLGGHISRAHKHLTSKVKIEEKLKEEEDDDDEYEVKLQEIMEQEFQIPKPKKKVKMEEEKVECLPRLRRDAAKSRKSSQIYQESD